MERDVRDCFLEKERGLYLAYLEKSGVVLMMFNMYLSYVASFLRI